ncbi:ribonuclease HII [Jeotgalibacillus haloalkalitolerans]|uniref:Ribonuclease HII n=1 Tax=Jeotgalibacillus haloalkalitolerans TaxID=3104292 RepID=A0ABU5KKB3_9BACL|nr:ribonuclease HII [Jeotgalibacillus sp. HH7-29]MDZ5711702.1 ribonuclease HII [Jeotgalibacillus sp. HH7-29]
MLKISQIKEMLTESPDEELINQLKSDDRKGVQKLLKSYQKKIEKDQMLAQQFKDMQAYEKAALLKGYSLIAGTDEAGRGPLAGPVVAAAVILPEGFYLAGLNDSKKLSEQKRELFFEEIMTSADVGVGIIEAAEIDRINILNASKQAMIKAIRQLKQQPEYVLADAVTLDIQIPQKSIIKGDAKSVSIAAASVIAKVTRDRLMKEAAEKYPGYDLEKNAGYGTKDHIEAIKKLGLTGEHRRSFEPVKSMFQS